MVTKTKFTPGPWFAVNVGSNDEPMMSVKAARIAGREPRHEVAICATGDSPQEMETANSNLIAAAPEMYAALVAMTEAIRESAQYKRGDLLMNDVLTAADAAMRKVRGE